MPRCAIRRLRVVRSWTAEEDRLLILGVGAYGWAWFRAHLKDRTDREIRSRLKRLIGSSQMTRGVYSLARAVETTGYAVTQLRRAQRALGQKWRRTCESGIYMLTEEQLEELTEWLRQDYWSAKLELYGCVWCGTSERPPKGSGLCEPCYFKARRRFNALGLPATVEGQLVLVQDLIERGGLDLGVSVLERCQGRLKRRVAPEISDLKALARIMEGLS